jgi:hypothetical protein
VPASLRAQQSNLQFGVDNVLGGYIILWDGNTDIYPEFIDPLEDFALKLGSPCINNGRSDTMTSMIPEFDLNGDPRITGDEIDMGAYEYQGPFSISERRIIKSSVVPNPSNGYFSIQMESDIALPAKLEVFSISGSILHEQQLNSIKDNIDLTNLSDGVYLLKVTGNGHTRMSKVIIRK